MKAYIIGLKLNVLASIFNPRMKITKKNNRGDFTVEQILKIVLAVAGIAILIILMYSLYGVFTSKSKSEQAKALLQQLKEKIDGMKEGQEDEFFITAPKDWAIISSPDLCTGSICLCTCDLRKITGMYEEKRRMQVRDECKICQEFDYNIEIGDMCEKEDAHTVLTTTFFGEVPNCIKFKNGFFTTKIRRTSTGVFLYLNKESSTFITDSENFLAENEELIRTIIKITDYLDRVSSPEYKQLKDKLSEFFDERIPKDLGTLGYFELSMEVTKNEISAAIADRIINIHYQKGLRPDLQLERQKNKVLDVDGVSYLVVVYEAEKSKED